MSDHGESLLPGPGRDDGPRGSSAIPTPEPGVCRMCGCSESDACLDDDGLSCSWADAGRTLCSFCKAGTPGTRDSAIMADFVDDAWPPDAGVCRRCGCTDGDACLDVDGLPCDWADDSRTLCTACAPAEASEDVRRALSDPADTGDLRDVP